MGSITEMRALLWTGRRDSDSKCFLRRLDRLSGSPERTGQSGHVLCVCLLQRPSLIILSPRMASGIRVRALNTLFSDTKVPGSPLVRA